MRPTRLWITTCLTALIAAFILTTSCSQNEQTQANQKAEEARQKAEAAAHRMKQSAQQLAQAAKHKTQQLDQDLNRGINKDEDAPSHLDDKVEEATRGAKTLGRTVEDKANKTALLAQVKTKLASDVGLSTMTGVEVETTNTSIILTGTVPTREDSNRAEASVESVAGGRQVVNRLRVQPSSE